MSDAPANDPSTESFGDVTVTVGRDHVAVVELHRPPNNYFDTALLAAVADAYEAIDRRDDCRAIVLCAEGKHFCGGVDFATPDQAASAPPAEGGELDIGALYREAVRLFAATTPVVAAVHGAAVGGGLGLACSADFRVASSAARFTANFARLGFHQGFALTVTLPAIVGQQHAWSLLYSGRRIAGDEAAAIGLCDRLVEPGAERAAAHELAAELAWSAPLALASIRSTMREGLVERVTAALAHEAAEQQRLRRTEDWREGVRAAAERRPARFEGR